MLTTILHRDGRDPDSDGYAEQFSGKIIRIPYCWNSAVSTFDWADQCSIDTYDLSGDLVRYVGTETEHPDLDVVDKVIQYGQKRDVRAVLAYCSSLSVARRVVELMPPKFYGMGADWKERGANREILQLNSEEVWTIRFVLEKREGHWFVSDFKLE